jgi:hypothetical protein
MLRFLSRANFTEVRLLHARPRILLNERDARDHVRWKENTTLSAARPVKILITSQSGIGEKTFPGDGFQLCAASHTPTASIVLRSLKTFRGDGLPDKLLGGRSERSVGVG